VHWSGKVFDGYIKYNFHVSIAVWALAQITALDFGFPLHYIDQMIFFMAPFLGYNFIKFHLYFFKKEFPKSNFSILLFIFLLCSLFLFTASFYLPFSSQILLFLTLILVLLYCLPLPGFELNFRGFKGLKIHLVALSWVLISVFLPLSTESEHLSNTTIVYGFQRYLFVLVATLPFEIRDLKLDDPKLSTWPQKWGIKNTQIFGGVLLLLFVFIEVYFSPSNHVATAIFIALLLMILVLKANEDQTKYFSSFWVEGIPILWLILRIIFL